MKSREIMARLGNEDYVNKILTRGEAERPLSTDAAELAQQRAARAIVAQRAVINRMDAGFKRNMELTRLSGMLKAYVKTYVDNP